MGLSNTKFFISDCIEAIRLNPIWGRASKIVVGFVQFFSYASAVISTVLVKSRVEAVSSAHAGQNWHSYISPLNIPCLLWAASAYVAARVKISREHVLDRRAANEALKKLYDALELGKNQEHDIRATIWCPTAKRDHDGFPIQLEQWTDYVPKERPLKEGNPNQLLAYPVAGRRRPVLRRVKGRVVMIGLLGKCAYECIDTKIPATKIDVVPEDKTLVDYMINVWNFDLHYANKLTPDRRSFMCVPVMNAGRTELLGIVFIDSASADPRVLSKDMADRIEARLPEIARVISK